MQRTSIFLSALLVISNFTKGASSENLTYSTTDGKVTITNCVTPATGELVISETIEGSQVISIAQAAFYQCSNMSAVTISNSMITVGYNAFGKCISRVTVIMGNGVTSINLSERLTSILKAGFLRCSPLTEIQDVRVGSIILS